MISYTNIQLILLYTKKFCYICADNIPLELRLEIPPGVPRIPVSGPVGIVICTVLCD